MEIQTISRSHVRPSSPTPPNLKTYNLSGVDQINPSLYGPFIFFYPADPAQQPDPRRSFLLKLSLSHILSRYYPLAGRLRDSLSVDCCDAGAYYSQAKIVNSTNSSSVSQFLHQFDLASLRRLVPIDAVEGNSILSPPPPGSHLLLVQETSFPCGGIVIGVLMAHDLLDAFSIASFLKDWSAIARRLQNPDAGDFVGNPKFVGGAIFPQNEALFERLVDQGPSSTETTTTVARKRSVVTRRFVFRAPGLASLKDELMGSTVGKAINNTPSRVHAVSALLCSSILRAFKSVGRATTSTGRPVIAVTQAVNLRKKADPELPSNLMGNYIINAVANLPAINHSSMGMVVKVLRDSVSKMDAKFVEEIRGKEGKSPLAEVAREERTAVGRAWRRISFSSWSRLGFYEVDFGWGKPAWFGCLPCSDEEENVVVDLVMILDTRDGSGLEAWVFLEEDEMAVLETDQLLLSFASLDPTPLTGSDNVLTIRSSM